MKKILLQPVCILVCLSVASSHAKLEKKKGVKWDDLMADKKKQAEINHLYTEHYMRAVSGLLAAVGNDLHKEASFSTRRELKRCIASIAKDDKNPQKSEAKCVMHAYSMLDKEKYGVQWVGAFGIRRMKRQAKRSKRFSKYGSDFSGRPTKVIDITNQQFIRFRSRISRQAHPTSYSAIKPLSYSTTEAFEGATSGNSGESVADTSARGRKFSNIAAETKIFDNFKTSHQPANEQIAERRSLYSMQEAFTGTTNSVASQAGVEGANSDDERSTLLPNYSPVIERPSDNAARLVGSAERENERMVVHQMTSMPHLMGSNQPIIKSPVAYFANLAAELLRGNESGKKSWKETYEMVKGLDHQMKALKQVEDQHRAFDNVLRERSSFSLAKTDEEVRGPDEDKNPLKEVQNMNAFIHGLHASEKENLEFLSPKFAPLLPSDGTQKNRFLSPTLFSFYKDEKDPMNIASVPELMDATGFKSEDRDAVVDLIMEVSGARVQVEKTLEGMVGLADWQEVAKAMIEANLRMNSTWMQLLSSLTKKQQFEIDAKGFSFAEPKQLKDMYHKDDAYYKDTPQCDVPLDEYEQYDEDDRKHLLRRMVGQIARDTDPEMSAAMRTWPRRLKQRILNPFIFSGQILQPSVLSYIILSPTMFVANVLSPVIFNFELLSPRLFFPVILGPRLLSPRILGPRALSPWVLSPIVLSPSILRPLVLSPFILSPFLMSPPILAPTALGGRVLSPALLNPAILSPGALNLDVLSPTLLSKKRRKRNSRRYRRRL